MKSQISTQFNFVQLSKVFDVMDRKPRPGIGTNDRGSNNQDKRKPGENEYLSSQLLPEDLLPRSASGVSLRGRDTLRDEVQLADDSASTC